MSLLHTRSLCFLGVLFLGCSAPTPAPEPVAVQPVPQPAPVEAAPPATAAVVRGQAGPLRYLEVVPAGIDPDAALPIVVFIHGLGDEPRTAFIEGVQIRARFILPQAPAPYGRGYSWFPYRVRDQHPEMSAGIARAAEQLVEMLRVLRERRPTIGLPIIAGFSQGGMLSYAMALHHPTQVLAAHPISGMLPPDLWPEAPEPSVALPPIRAVHGDADTVVSFAAADAMVTALAARGFDISLQRFGGVRHTQTRAMHEVMVELLQAQVKRAHSSGAAVAVPR